MSEDNEEKPPATIVDDATNRHPTLPSERPTRPQNRFGGRNDSSKPVWETATIIGDNEFAIRVRRTTNTYRPRYSMECGRVSPDQGRYNGFIYHVHMMVDTRTTQGAANLISMQNTISRVVAEAEEFIRNDAQRREDEIIIEKQQKEERRLGAFGQPPRRKDM